MFALLRSIGSSWITKLVSFLLLALYAWWMDSKATTALEDKAQLEGVITVLQSTNLNNNKTILELQSSLEKQEALMLKRNVLASRVTQITTAEKAELNTQIKESQDENTITWADQPVPDVVVLMLKPP